MIRIGLSRWFVQAVKLPANNGQVEYALGLTPQATRYRVLAKEWRGLRSELVEREVAAEPSLVSARELRHEMSAVREVSLLRKLAGELANGSVEACLRAGIVDYQTYLKPAAVHLVEASLMRHVESGQSDSVEQPIAVVDLVADMRAILEERERERRERERIADENYAAHFAEMEQRELARQASTKTSFELLYGMLSASERSEAQAKGRVTIKNLFGDFVVPVTAHGLVRRYVDGEYEASYCVVFQDYSIAIGDEVLMKVALLRTDPQRFLKIANRFVERHGVLVA